MSSKDVNGIIIFMVVSLSIVLIVNWLSSPHEKNLWKKQTYDPPIPTYDTRNMCLLATYGSEVSKKKFNSLVFDTCRSLEETAESDLIKKYKVERKYISQDKWKRCLERASGSENHPDYGSYSNLLRCTSEID